MNINILALINLYCPGDCCLTASRDIRDLRCSNAENAPGENLTGTIRVANKANSSAHKFVDTVLFANRKEGLQMPNKDKTGPKGQGPKDGHGKGMGKGMGKGKGKGDGSGKGSMTGGKNGVKNKT